MSMQPTSAPYLLTLDRCEHLAERSARPLLFTHGSCELRDSGQCWKPKCDLGKHDQESDQQQ